MDFGLGFLSDYIAAAEIGDKTPTLTIASVSLEKVEQLKDGDQDGGDEGSGGPGGDGGDGGSSGPG